MNVSRIAVTPFRLPVCRPLLVGGREVSCRAGALIQLHGDGGLVGLGELSLHPLAPRDAVRAALEAVSETAAALMRRGPIPLAAVWTRVDAVPSPAVRAGLEMASCDLAARAAGVAVGEIVGSVMRASIPVNAVVDRRDADGAAAAARAYAAQGYRCIKLKVAPGDVGGEMARLAAVREAVGAEVGIRLDVNGGWTVAEAVAAIPRLAAYGIEYVEQPVATIADLARVRHAVGAPIAADECVAGVESVERIAELGAADVVVVKPAFLGLRAASAVIRRARDCGLAVVVTSAMDTSLGIAAAAHVAATLPDPIPPCGLATAALLAGDLVRPPLVPRGGWLDVPRGPGLGVELDAVACARWSKG